MTDDQHEPTEPLAEADGTEQVAEVVADTGGPSLRTALEAILMVVDEPVGEVLLAQVTEKPTETVLATLRELAEEYDEQERGFQLREVAGGWRFYTRASAAASSGACTGDRRTPTCTRPPAARREASRSRQTRRAGRRSGETT